MKLAVIMLGLGCLVLQPPVVAMAETCSSRDIGESVKCIINQEIERSQGKRKPAGKRSRMPSFPKDTLYSEARRSLVGLGYVPTKLPGAEECGGDERCDGFPEVLTCSGTGLGHCIFVWRAPNDMLVEIITVGDNITTVSGARCRANCR